MMTSTMSPAAQAQTMLLFEGIGGALLVASLVGFLLKLKVGLATPHSVIDNLNSRIKA